MNDNLIRGLEQILRLRQGRFKWGQIQISTDVEIPICDFMNNKFIRIEEACVAAATFTRLSTAEQQSILTRAFEKASHPNFVSSVINRMQWPDVVPAYLMYEGLGYPPFHGFCTCRVNGVCPELGDVLPSCEMSV